MKYEHGVRCPACMREPVGVKRGMMVEHRNMTTGERCWGSFRARKFVAREVARERSTKK